MTCEEAREVFVLLSGREAGASAVDARRHLDACIDCVYWLEGEDRLTALLSAAEDVLPPSSLKAGVMSLVRAEPERKPEQALGWKNPLVIFEAVAATIALGFFATSEGTAAVVDVLRLVGELLATSVEAAASVIFEGSVWARNLQLGEDSSLESWAVTVGAIALAGNFVVLLNGRTSRRSTQALMAAFAVAVMLVLPECAAASSVLQDEETQKATRESLDALKILALGAILVASALGASAIGICLRALAPRLVARADFVAATRSNVYSFFVGLFNAIILLVLAVLLVRVPGPPRFLGILLLAGLAVVTAIGHSARLRIVGSALAPNRSALVQDAVAAVLLATAMLCPLAGQLFWIALLIQAFGSGLLSFARRRAGDITDNRQARP